MEEKGQLFLTAEFELMSERNTSRHGATSAALITTGEDYQWVLKLVSESMLSSNKIF